MYNKGPFATWLPKPLMLLLIIIFTVIIMPLGGVYTTNTTDLAGALASYNEYISLANNATTIGMAVTMIVILRLKMRFRTKAIITTSCIILAVLSLTIAHTDSVLTLVICSFLIGPFKMLVMIEMMLPLMFILSPTGERGKFYSVFYPFSICLSQLSGYIMASYTFDVSYQAPYYIMAILLLILALLSMLFQHNDRFCFKLPLYQIDWISLLILATWAMSLNVVLTFMRQQDWFNSPYITNLLIISIALFIWLVARQKSAKRKLIKFKVILQRVNIWHSLILLMCMGVYFASSSLFVQYTTGILGYTNLQNSKLNLWLIPGIIIAAVLAAISFRKQWYLKYLLYAGFISFFIHTLMLYQMIQPQVNIESFYFAMIVKGFAMATLYISIWYYASFGVPMDDLLGIFGILLMFRTFVSTAFAGAIISLVAYANQWQSLSDIALHLDSSQSTSAVYGSMQLNSLMNTIKIVLGMLCWFTIPVLLFITTHHYGRIKLRRIALYRKFVKGNSVKGYHFTR